MQKISSQIKSKDKIIIVPVVILLVLISIFVSNSLQKNDSAIVNAGNETYMEVSGTVESNLVSLSSEVTGTIIETVAKEGDTVKAGQVIAEINNTSLTNQYDQALINFQISEKNIELIENNINNLNLQNENSVQLAQSAYFAAQAEYEK
ncbi:MAG: biotin/lipoyl-binding protein, partial [Sedimentibacter sp.]